MCAVGHMRSMKFSSLDVTVKHLSTVSRSFEVKGILFTETTHFTTPHHTTCKNTEIPEFFSVYARSDCKVTYKNVTNSTAVCHADFAWLQHAWVQHCFASFEKQKFNLYIRIRPDVVAIPTQISSQFNMMVHHNLPIMMSGIKVDAPYSDMLFILNNAGIRQYMQVPQANLPRGCCSDYYIWPNIKYIQQIPLCLVRNSRTLQCWTDPQESSSTSYTILYSFPK